MDGLVRDDEDRTGLQWRPHQRSARGHSGTLRHQKVSSLTCRSSRDSISGKNIFSTYRLSPSATYYVTLEDFDRSTSSKSRSIQIAGRAIPHSQYISSQKTTSPSCDSIFRLTGTPTLTSVRYVCPSFPCLSRSRRSPWPVRVARVYWVRRSVEGWVTEW